MGLVMIAGVIVITTVVLLPLVAGDHTQSTTVAVPHLMDQQREVAVVAWQSRDPCEATWEDRIRFEDLQDKNQ